MNSPHQAHQRPHHFSLPETLSQPGGEPSQTNRNNDDVIANAFHQDGFVILSQALDPDLVRSWHDFAEIYFERIFQELYRAGHTSAPTHREKNNNNNSKSYVLGLGAKNGFSEIVMRSPGRYELSIKSLLQSQQQETRSNFSKFQDMDFPDPAEITTALESLLPKLLGGGSPTNWKICHFSLLTATPGSTNQAWHADGGHVSLEEHLPCHVLNLFVPLQEIPHELGPTEFRPQGHVLTRNLAPMMLAAKCRKTLRPPYWPSLEVGDIVAFDYRILHRGRANQSPGKGAMNRHVLVVTICEEWFQDILNFPTKSMLDDPARPVTTQS